MEYFTITKARIYRIDTQDLNSYFESGGWMLISALVLDDLIEYIFERPRNKS